MTSFFAPVCGWKFDVFVKSMYDVPAVVVLLIVLYFKSLAERDAFNLLLKELVLSKAPPRSSESPGFDREEIELWRFRFSGEVRFLLLEGPYWSIRSCNNLGVIARVHEL